MALNSHWGYSVKSVWYYGIWVPSEINTYFPTSFGQGGGVKNSHMHTKLSISLGITTWCYNNNKHWKHQLLWYGTKIQDEDNTSIVVVLAATNDMCMIKNPKTLNANARFKTVTREHIIH